MEAMTSAMQMVADRETPTRQCTSVAVPSCRPFSMTPISTNPAQTGLQVPYR